MCFTVSPRGGFVFAADSGSRLFCFSTTSGKLEHMLPLHEKEVIGLCHHPLQNLLASWADDGTLKLWAPTS